VRTRGITTTGAFFPFELLSVKFEKKTYFREKKFWRTRIFCVGAQGNVGSFYRRIWGEIVEIFGKFMLDEAK
jgi:hypothetical protein